MFRTLSHPPRMSSIVSSVAAGSNSVSKRTAGMRLGFSAARLASRRLHGVRAHMTYLRKLAQAELLAVSAFLLSASALTALIAFAPGAEVGVLAGANGFKALLSTTLLVGALPIVFYGAPGYAALRCFGRASWPAVILLGIAPGSVLLLADSLFGLFGLLYGVVVAGVMHLVTEVRSNYVSKRTAGERLQSFRPLLASGRLTRR
jgi:hypothetical protein